MQWLSLALEDVVVVAAVPLAVEVVPVEEEVCTSAESPLGPGKHRLDRAVALAMRSAFFVDADRAALRCCCRGITFVKNVTDLRSRG